MKKLYSCAVMCKIFTMECAKVHSMRYREKCACTEMVTQDVR